MDQMTWQGSREVREVVQAGSWQHRTPHTVHGSAHANNLLFYKTQQDGSVNKVLALQE